MASSLEARTKQFSWYMAAQTCDPLYAVSDSGLSLRFTTSPASVGIREHMSTQNSGSSSSSQATLVVVAATASSSARETVVSTRCVGSKGSGASVVDTWHSPGALSSSPPRATAAPAPPDPQVCPCSWAARDGNMQGSWRFTRHMRKKVVLVSSSRMEWSWSELADSTASESQCVSSMGPLTQRLCSSWSGGRASQGLPKEAPRAAPPARSRAASNLLDGAMPLRPRA
mmetsp:Transcript_2654/g.8730  ORF Transcript_2654/g.8730 Transcript_2654/m.8730 type:complete len:228 (+) Transcript_2654:1286-1969(+)